MNILLPIILPILLILSIYLLFRISFDVLKQLHIECSFSYFLIWLFSILLVLVTFCASLFFIKDLFL